MTVAVPVHADRRLIGEVRRIDDERGLREGAARVVKPEWADRALVALLGTLLDVPGPGREFLVGLKQTITERLRPRHRNAGRVVARPHADQIRFAPRRLRRL